VTMKLTVPVTLGKLKPSIVAEIFFFLFIYNLNQQSEFTFYKLML
jgi:hypothetical protein